MPRPARTVKFFTRDSLIAANKKAIRTDRNRTLEPKVLKTLDPLARFPVVLSVLHNDGIEIRLTIVYNENGDVAWLDVPLKTYNNLPEVQMPEEAVLTEQG